MGIPKFFRWMSERYPLCSQLITENRIPEFDNLYLDMNGIIHNCSHPKDEDAHYRISEDEIFIAIFNYIDHLFLKIKPKKLFFMAIDGVAPRAKMNQQRSRRFRTARDAAERIRLARQRGEELPEEAPFDSNCITPGTEFMAKLSKQLQYFVTKKVSEDANWRDIDVVLSGHDVPGEGEHKIMEYIRLSKAQPDYNPNVRHCLYGLDADLIMLGLLSHDPHFALLREEVVFGKQRNKKPSGPESQNFYLLHLSILREYLDLEFSSLRNTLNFDYDLERIIDDFILLGLFVGNDFLPHLPNLHINEGALALMFNIYKKVLPKCDGYINDGGTLNVQRLELVLNELCSFERETFEAEVVDLQWLHGKRADGAKGKRGSGGGNKIALTPRQKELYEQIRAFILNRPTNQSSLHFPPDLPGRDRHFVQKLAQDLGVRAATEHDHEDHKHVYIEVETSDSSDEEDEESEAALQRVLKKYDQAEIIEDDVGEEEDLHQQRYWDEKFKNWRKEYYWEKMRLDIDSQEDMDSIVKAYLEGLQWVLHYYYNGVASWGWFYPFHFSPKISDLRNLDRFEISFDYGKPFKPFEQLMGVLPSLSGALIPPAFRSLMTDPASPIIDFYPLEFELDMNGKKQDWEAVVKIPFIEEGRLLKAMRRHENQLTAEERERNSFGDSLVFKFDPTMEDVQYPSSLPGVFPDIVNCRCKKEIYYLPTLSEGLTYVRGLCDGARLGASALPGFPTLHTIPHTGALAYHGVKVFQQESKNETMVITLENRFEDQSAEDVAHELVNKRVYINWPYLQEALVIAVSSDMGRYELVKDDGNLVYTAHSEEKSENWRRRSANIETAYSKRLGTVIGPVEIVAHCLMLKGLKRLDDGSLVKEWRDRKEEVEYAVQTTVAEVEYEDPRFMERPPLAITEEFPLRTHVFFLGALHYGAPAEVVDHGDNSLTIKLIVTTNGTRHNEPAFGQEIAMRFERECRYYPSFVVAKQLGINALTLSKLTASLHIVSQDQRVNVGLNLKFEAKKQKVLGYTRKTENGWEYSDKAIALLREYKQKFPEFVANLDRRMRDDLYQAETLIPPPHDAVEKVKEIRAWLKGVEAAGLERVPLDAVQLDKASIAKIEKCADLQRKETTYHTVIIKNIPRHAVLKPSHAPTRLRDQYFALGDRVISVIDSGVVPIATKGTVVGVEGSQLEIVFDDSFMGGTTLGGRCSMYRGMGVPAYTVLNLTQQQYRGNTVNKNSRPPIHHHPNPNMRGAGRGGRAGRGGGIGGFQQPHPIQSVQPRPPFNSRGLEGHRDPMVEIIFGLVQVALAGVEEDAEESDLLHPRAM
ncbi:uncharacterized protein VTP21DRAFT_1472 [Calcarisporiella thermophila]|uniref:uncharacterized protein n=1 Tax=Calcarisporiella thermophila TaxID=911321 RepID=UPI0037435B88